jgi:Xaa-Pro aminopeptidase
MPDQILQEKIKQAAQLLNDKNIDMWITFIRESSNIHDPVQDMILGINVTWKSAFIITRDGDAAAIIGSLDHDNIKQTGLYKNIIVYKDNFGDSLVEYLEKKDPEKIAVNYSQNSNLADGLTHGMYLLLMNYLMDTKYRFRLVSSEDLVSALKGRKSPAELENMKNAVKVTLEIIDETTKFIKPGITEIDISDFMKAQVIKRGFELAWDENHCPSVFTGPIIKGPHLGPEDRIVEKGHLVNVDFGIKYNGYCSDLQRTWYVLKDGEDKAPAEVQKGFDVIRDSVHMVKDKIKPGVQGCEMDDIARNHIIKNGYAEYKHGLGHQVGKNVHDGGAGLFPRWEHYGNLPYLKLEESQVFTIEPRLTVEGHGVATIEEEIFVTKNGCEFISEPQKELWLIK